jgi:hypothetical protein
MEGMTNTGLLLMSLIQLGTGVTALFSVNQSYVWGIRTLPREFSTYRYMLTALWLSVGLFYLIGAFSEKMAPGAGLLALINAALEIGGYWLSPLPMWYKRLGTGVMGLVGLWCVLVVF